MRPVIGITTYAEEATWGRWTEPAAFIPLAYVRAVERAGGRPLLVPPVADGVEETLDVLDGIIFSGGGDLDPDTYGAEAHPETNEVSPERDNAELVLLQAALGRDMPVLARVPREPGAERRPRRRSRAASTRDRRPRPPST